MHGCAAYVLPTKPEPDFVETFGIALAEKMLAGGGPVITSSPAGSARRSATRRSSCRRATSRPGGRLDRVVLGMPRRRTQGAASGPATYALRLRPRAGLRGAVAPGLRPLTQQSSCPRTGSTCPAG